MWRFIFVSSVGIAEIFSLLFLAAAAITHICTNANGQTRTYKTTLAFWQKWGDEMIWEISHRGHHFQGQLSFPRHRLSGHALRSHSSDNGMDAKLKMDFFFPLQEVFFCPDGSEKSPSHSAEQWWKLHHLLSLNLTWGDVSKMVACMVSCALLKSLPGVHFSQSPSWMQIEMVSLQDPLWDSPSFLALSWLQPHHL